MIDEPEKSGQTTATAANTPAIWRRNGWVLKAVTRCPQARRPTPTSMTKQLRPRADAGDGLCVTASAPALAILCDGYGTRSRLGGARFGFAFSRFRSARMSAAC